MTNQGSRTLGLVLAAAGFVLSGCSKVETAESVVQASAPPPNALEITPNENLRDQIHTGVVGWADVGTALTVAAHIQVDENRVTRIGSPLMGRVKQLAFREGEDVRGGQLVAVLDSPGLTDGQLQVLKALSQKQLAERAVERAKILVDAAVIGSAELQRREAELAGANAELNAARDQLALLGMPHDAIEQMEKTRTLNSVSRVLATMDGTVLSRKATVGEMVEPAETLYEVADLSSVWLVADVPEEIAGNLGRGHTVEAEVAALPGKTFRGTLSLIAATVNPETRTIRVRMDLPNPDRRLKPEMLATMILRGPSERKPVVPIAAVVREENQEHVFVQIDENKFQLRPVVLGPEQNGTRVLMEGLQPKEKIVVEGAFHLNNERRRIAIRGSEGE